jgi:hypothetical protein
MFEFLLHTVLKYKCATQGTMNRMDTADFIITKSTDQPFNYLLPPPGPRLPPPPEGVRRR